MYIDRQIADDDDNQEPTSAQTIQSTLTIQTSVQW